MKIAITTFGSRVSPRFDTSHNMIVISFLNRQEEYRDEVVLEEKDIFARIRSICDLGISALVCGAIGDVEQDYLLRNGIEVVSGVTGRVDNILGMLINKQWLPKDCFWEQAFCGSGGWRRKRGCNFFKGGLNMPWGDGTGPAGQGSGGGRGMGGGQGGGGQRRGRMGGFGAGPGGLCVCPNCGTTAPHRQGGPCNQQVCPKCQSSMTRST